MKNNSKLKLFQKWYRSKSLSKFDSQLASSDFIPMFLFSCKKSYFIFYFSKWEFFPTSSKENIVYWKDIKFNTPHLIEKKP